MYKATHVVFLAVLVLFSFTNVALANEWIPLDGSPKPTQPEVTVIETNTSETIIDYTLSGFTSEPIVFDGTEYQSLRLPGHWTTLEVGKPQLPVINELIAVPDGARLKVSVERSTAIVLGNYNIYPFQTPLREIETQQGFDIDESFYYTQSNSYPAEIAVTDAPGSWRSLRVVKLTVQPFQFNPATGELTVYTNLTIKVDYEGGHGYEMTREKPITPAYDRIYSSGILNYDKLQLPVSHNSGTRAYDMLIIAEDVYVDNMNSFVSWKNTQGITTNVVSMSTVGSTVTDIKNYITQEYNNNNISYVLFVGNETDVPMYTGYGFVSDYYYALIAGSDDYADIAFGRFCVHSEADCNTMVSKSIAFEQNPPAGDWLDNTVLVANWELAPGKYQGCKEEIRTETYSHLTPDFTTQYGASIANGGDEATNADVIASINGGQRVVNYRGHGSETAWTYWNTSGEYFDLSDVAALSNGAMTPVIFGIACLNANLSHSTNTLAEAFTLDSEGAVAYLGASDPSYTTANHTYDKQLYLSTFHDGIDAIGDISNLAATRIINDHGSTGLTNARMYFWLGDPTLEIIYGGSTPPTYASLPYSTGFESGSLDQYWTTQSDNAEGRILVTTANTPRGSYHLTMDDNLDASLYAQNEAWLHVDLSGQANVDLTFWWKEFSDEDHTQDGVFFSDNGGSSFTKVHDLIGGTTTYQQIALDVDQLAAANGLSLSSTFVIKFQQYDNYGITTDGMAFDDVSVTGTGGSPPVADFSGTPTSGTRPLTVVFTDLSTNSPTSWSWDFGDTGSATTQNPTHVYTSAGTYTVTLTATNAYGSDDEVKTGYITVTDPSVNYANLPYSTGFETGAFDQYWTSQSDNAEGRIQITTANTPRGSYHLTMDDNLDASLYAQNEAWLHVNLSGHSNVDLTFWWKEFSDEDHTQDGVFFSDDGGTSFTKVHDLIGGTATYQEIALDVDQLATANGLSLSSTFVIKFQQYDNYGITTDGMAFDDVSVTAGGSGTYASIPYSTGFESGAFDQYWFTQSDNAEGRILLTTANTPRGSYHLTMDDNLNGGLFAQNEAWLRVDLSGESNVDLTFWWKEFSDEDHTQDGVFFSDNGGTSFTKVHSLVGGTATYQEIVLDVDQLASANGLSLTGTFVIKFQQYDNYGITTDGMAFDDVSVTAGGSSGYASIPYSTGFESGTFDQYWFTQSDNAEGRILLTTANTPRGSYHLTMDDNLNAGLYAQNEAWLKVNLAGHANVGLTFWWKEFSDEDHTQDGVFFSDDGGTTFTKVHSLVGGTATYQQISLDVDQLASANGVSLTGTFVIKFQQYDNYGITTDGMAFDDVNVTTGTDGVEDSTLTEFESGSSERVKLTMADTIDEE